MYLYPLPDDGRMNDRHMYKILINELQRSCVVLCCVVSCCVLSIRMLLADSHRGMTEPTLPSVHQFPVNSAPYVSCRVTRFYPFATLNARTYHFKNPKPFTLTYCPVHTPTHSCRFCTVHISTPLPRTVNNKSLPPVFPCASRAVGGLAVSTALSGKT
jgi:hypothetical protein